jgi:type III secretion protein C
MNLYQLRMLFGWLFGSLCQLTLLVMCLCSISLSSTVYAAEIVWSQKPFVYVAEDKKLTDFIREFASTQGLTVSIAPGVDGAVNARFNLKPKQMMELLASSYGLIWYYDGNILYVYPSDESKSALIRLNAAQLDQVRQSLKRLNVLDSRYPIIFDYDQGTMLVSGPKRMVELIEQISGIADDNSKTRRVPEIRIYPLKYASAKDTVYTAGGKEVKVPGMVSTLQSILKGASNVKGVSGGKVGGGEADQQKAYFDDQNTKMTSALKRLGQANTTGSDDDRTGRRKSGSGVADDGSKSFTTKNSSLDGSDENLPQVSFDGRLNAVLIRDYPERHASHAELIRRLDIKAGLIEIEASIMEVNSDYLEQLGLDWRTGGANFDIGFARGNQSALKLKRDGSSIGNPVPVVTGGAPAFTTVLSNAGRELVARVNALSTSGKGRVLSTPKVLTTDNLEANIENSSTIYVRVAGNLEANLFAVTVGTTLKVTPFIIDEGSARYIKLTVTIEDGNFDDSRTVDTVPRVQRNTINTQATIREGESLLVAGLATDRDTNEEGGVPGLSSVPIIGNLFKFTEKKRSRTDRIVMLTPRIMAN